MNGGALPNAPSLAPGPTAPARRPPRVGIVSTTPWLAQGLAAALADEARWQLIVMPSFEPAQAYVLHPHDEAQAFALAADLPPSAAVVWIGVAPDIAGADAAQALLPAQAGSEQLRAALAAVLLGLSVRTAAAPWPPARAVASPGAAQALAEGTEPLTTRELEVFELLAKGLSNRDIAGVLGISSHTAKFHVAQILAKVGAATRAEAVALGLRLGLIGL